MDTTLPNQPQSNYSILRNSFHLYRMSFSTVLIFAFLTALTIFIPRIVDDIFGYDIVAATLSFRKERLWILLINLMTMLFFIALLWRMYSFVRGYHEPLVVDLKIGLKKVLYVILATIIQSAIMFVTVVVMFGIEIWLHRANILFNQDPFSMLITFLVFFAQVFLILYISTLFIFFIPLIAIENKGIIGSLERSIRLVWNHWWRTFSLQLTPWICFIVSLAFIRFLIGINIHIYFLEESQHSFWITLFQIVLFMLFLPWVAALLLLQLKDLELRKHITQLDKNALK